MKKIILTTALFLIAINVFSQSKKDLINEIYNYYEKTINETKFKKSKKDIWAGMYQAVKNNYNTMIVESESRGVMEAQNSNELELKKINLELVSLDSSFSLIYNFTYNIKVGEQWINNLTDKYKTSMKLKIYESIMGELKLSDELQAKVDEFNSKQKKENKKIKKGIDY